MSRLLPALATAFACLALWELLCRLTALSPLILPPPSGVARALWWNSEALARHLGATILVTVPGFALSVSVALLLSVLLHHAPRIERALVPLFVVSQTIPLIALAPLMILWFGFGLVPKLLLVVLVTFFPVLVSLLAGYAQAPVVLRDLLISMRASPAQIFRRVTFPAALPAFFAGLRISGTYAVVATIFAEYAGAKQGLGIAILTAKNNFRPDLILAAVTLSALLTLSLLALIRLIERRVTC